jgi:hypothetical protein
VTLVSRARLVFKISHSETLMTSTPHPLPLRLEL